MAVTEAPTMGTLADVFFTRIWWTADVEHRDGRILLRLRRGARHVAIWKNSLEVFNERIEPSERLRPDVGDRFVVCGPSIDETLAAEVVDVVGEDRIAVAMRGGLAETTSTVQLLEMISRKIERRG